MRRREEQVQREQWDNITPSLARSHRHYRSARRSSVYVCVGWLRQSCGGPKFVRRADTPIEPAHAGVPRSACHSHTRIHLSDTSEGCYQWLHRRTALRCNASRCIAHATGHSGTVVRERVGAYSGCSSALCLPHCASAQPAASTAIRNHRCDRRTAALLQLLLALLAAPRSDLRSPAPCAPRRAPSTAAPTFPLPFVCCR